MKAIDLLLISTLHSWLKLVLRMQASFKVALLSFEKLINQQFYWSLVTLTISTKTNKFVAMPTKIDWWQGLSKVFKNITQVNKVKVSRFLETFLYYASFFFISGTRKPIPTQARTPAPITNPLEIGKISRIAFAMIKAMIKHMRLAL